MKLWRMRYYARAFFREVCGVIGDVFVLGLWAVALSIAGTALWLYFRLHP